MVLLTFVVGFRVGELAHAGEGRVVVLRYWYFAIIYLSFDCCVRKGGVAVEAVGGTAPDRL